MEDCDDDKNRYLTQIKYFVNKITPTSHGLQNGL